MQLERDTLPGRLLKEPAGQGVQSEEPAVLAKVPKPHAGHAVAAVAALKEPTVQGVQESAALTPPTFVP